MYNFITIGDPVLDTLVQLSDDTAKLRVNPAHELELCLQYGGKVPIVDSFQALGGNAANVAAGVARLGLSSAIVTTLGKDDLAMMVVDLLKKSGIATDYVTHDATTKTRYSIVLNYQTDRTILSYSDARNYVWPKEIKGADWIYYTGLSQGYESLQTEVLAYLKKHTSVRLAFNPGSKMLQDGIGPLKPLLAQTDVLIVNLEEAEMIAKTKLAETKTITSLLHKLLELGPDEVVITDGENGAWAGNHETIWHLNSFPVPVISKVGAGDAFSAAYLAARQADHDIPHALQWGVANSSGVIQALGSQAGQLDETGMQKMLSQFKTITPTQV